MTHAAPARARISETRISPDNQTVLQNLSLLQEFAGTWKGHGFNLIARPDFHDKTDLYLQLNQTRETLKLDPIGSAVPNRGFGQDDIELFGLTYLQQIADSGRDGALHIEPGIWVIQPDTTFPPEAGSTGQRLVTRMGTIPHGNSLLAQGVAAHFKGAPVLTVPGGAQYSGSLFPSFNTTPFAVPPTAPGIVFNAAGSSEKLTAPKVPPPAPGAPPPAPFPQYDLSIPVGPLPPGPLNPPFALNTRTPFETSPAEPALPSNVNGVPMQDVINDPILLIQKDVENLVEQGYTFEGTVINIASQPQLTFFKNPNSAPTDPTVPVNVPQFGGGIENIQFLDGESPVVGGNPQLQENAQSAVFYATFWIEKVSNERTGHSFMQVQYAQMVVLNFPIFHLLQQTPPVYVNLGWPHVSVATLTKSFN